MVQGCTIGIVAWRWFTCGSSSGKVEMPGQHTKSTWCSFWTQNNEVVANLKCPHLGCALIIERKQRLFLSLPQQFLCTGWFTPLKIVQSTTHGYNGNKNRWGVCMVPHFRPTSRKTHYLDLFLTGSMIVRVIEIYCESCKKLRRCPLEICLKVLNFCFLPRFTVPCWMFN